MKRILPFLLSTLLILVFTTPTFALTLDKIGSTTTATGKPTQWLYSAANPLLSGTTLAGDVVAITIDGTESTTVADSAGNWSFQPTTLTTGEHTVVFADSQQTFTTMITIGSTSTTTTTATGSAQTLPVSGSLTQTLAILGAGAAVIFMGIKLSKNSA